MNVDELFREQARIQPDHPAILSPSFEPLSYRSLDERIEKVRIALEQAGVVPGATVAVHIPSGVDYIVHCYAVWRQGGCVVPVPTELTNAEKSEICKDIAIDFLLSDEESPNFGRRSNASATTTISPNAAITALVPEREHPAGFHTTNAAFIRFTSGTTGTSKGVVLSHETIFDRIRAANDGLHVGPSDRVVWVLSMSYHFTVSIVGYLSFGASIVLPANNLAAGLMEAICDCRGTLLYASPMHYALLASAADDVPDHDLRLAISTAMSLDLDVARSFRRKFGIPVAQALGIIEVGLPAINLVFAADHPEAVGSVLPAYHVCLEDVGLDDGTGEILVEGPGILDAYYEPWSTRDEILDGGWFRTGDIGQFDANGCLFVRGRSKDVINVMGMKFFPQEVEAVLRAHPDVRDACVFARHSAQIGDRACARVVPRPGSKPSAKKLLQHCRESLTEFKLPHEIEFVDRLDRTASGKLLRRDTEPANSSAVT